MVIAVAFLWGCTTSPTLSATTRPIDTSVYRPTEQSILTISLQIPAFAGYYCEDGNLRVLVKGPLSEADADIVRSLISLDTVSSCYDPELPDKVPEIILGEASFDFLALRTWRDEIWSNFLDLPGAHGIAIDFGRNSIVFVLRNQSATSESDVATFASGHGIPSEAYVVLRKPSPVLQACSNPSDGPLLTDCFRPVTAGPIGVLTLGAGGTIGDCTIGSANDRFISNQGFWQSGFTTNAHCGTMFRMNSDWLWQNNSSGGNAIAVEFVDPNGWSCGAFGLYECRYSDAAWFWATGAAAQHGTIAKPTHSAGSKTVDTSSPRFHISGKATPTQGMIAHKVGQTTGWTTGPIDWVCFDVNTNVLNRRLICQSVGRYGSSHGDSGAPVFQWNWLGTTVQYLGIHWGGDNDVNEPGDDWVYFSPQDGVDYDIGGGNPLYIAYPYF